MTGSFPATFHSVFHCNGDTVIAEASNSSVPGGYAMDVFAYLMEAQVSLLLLVEVMTILIYIEKA